MYPLQKTEQNHKRLTIGKYEVDREIGKGGFSNVYLAYHSKTKERVAIKVINRKTTLKMDMLNYLENEIRLISRFDHPNIVKVYDIVYTEEDICIVMEYLPNGSLQSLIDMDFPFTPIEQVKIATEILEGINYLHQRGISHRDIKPGNILFDENMNAKIIDFGFSNERNSLLHTFCGTQLFMAPEIISNHSYDGKKADIWAFGVTAHLFASKTYPFNISSEVQFVNDVKNKKLDIVVEATGILGWVIKNSLLIDPNERLNSSDLLQYVRQHSSFPTQSVTMFLGPKRAKTTCPVPNLKCIPSSPLLARPRITNKLVFRGYNIQRRQIRSLE